MLRNKKVNIVLSLLMAVALWAFVIGEVNPETSRLYREVPIEFANQEVLDDHGLAVLSTSQETLNVTLIGSRSEINQIDKEDVTAVVNLEEAGLGSNELAVEVKVSGQADVDSQSVNKVTVTVEKRVAKEVDVRVTYLGHFTSDAEPITVEQSMETVEVSGAETNVAKVAAAEAVVEEGTVQEKSETFTCGLKPVDGDGNQVDNVDLSEEEVQITAEMAKTKTVPLDVPIVDGKRDSVTRTVEVPDTVILKGRSGALEDIERVTTEDVVLDGIITDTTIPITPILPEHVELSNENSQLAVVVHVDRTNVKSFSFDAADITLSHLGEGLSAAVKKGTVTVDLSGDFELLEQAEKGSVTLTVDLSGRGAGEHKLPLTATCRIDGVTVTVNPATVTVVVEKEDETPSGDQNDNNIDDNGSIEE